MGSINTKTSSTTTSGKINNTTNDNQIKDVVHKEHSYEPTDQLSFEKKDTNNETSTKNGINWDKIKITDNMNFKYNETKELQLNNKNNTPNSLLSNHHFSDFIIVTLFLMINILILKFLKNYFLRKKKRFIIYNIIIFPFLAVSLPVIYYMYDNGGGIFSAIDIIIWLVLLFYIYLQWKKYKI